MAVRGYRRRGQPRPWAQALARPTTTPTGHVDVPAALGHPHRKPVSTQVALGIAEVNLAGLLGELGTTWSTWGQRLIPVATIYDPFVSRALEPWSYGIHAGGQSILVGTPSGVTLAPEGGAHQSITTPSIGLEQPALLERRRQQAVSGGYRLSAHPAAQDEVTLVGVGALMPEVIEAAHVPKEQGLTAGVVSLTSPDLVFRSFQRRGLLVTEFGQSSDLADSYAVHGIDVASIIDAAFTLAGR